MPGAIAFESAPASSACREKRGGPNRCNRKWLRMSHLPTGCHLLKLILEFIDKICVNPMSLTKRFSPDTSTYKSYFLRLVLKSEMPLPLDLSRQNFIQEIAPRTIAAMVIDGRIPHKLNDITPSNSHSPSIANPSLLLLRNHRSARNNLPQERDSQRISGLQDRSHEF